MSTPRKKYRPYGVNPTAHLVALMGVQLLSKSDVLKRAVRLRECVELAAKGTASIEDWRHLFDCVNVLEQLARMRVVKGQEAIEAVQEVIAGIHDRHKATGTKALRFNELAALRDLASDYAEIISGVTTQQYFLAQRGVEDRIRRVLSGERMPVSMRVVEAAC